MERFINGLLIFICMSKEIPQIQSIEKVSVLEKQVLKNTPVKIDEQITNLRFTAKGLLFLVFNKYANLFADCLVKFFINAVNQISN